MKKEVQIIKYERPGVSKIRPDWVAQESSIAIYLNGTKLTEVLCSPIYTDELAAGYLFSCGLLERDTEFKVEPDISRGLVKIEATRLNPDKLKLIHDHRCNNADTTGRTGSINGGEKINIDDLLAIMEQLLVKSDLFKETGAIHTYALKLPEGLVFREDVSRNNALHKLTGYCIINRCSTKRAALFTSSRISGEIMNKVNRLGVPVIVSRGAPTSLAVELAEKTGITLVGFARGGSANIYSHPERIKIKI